MKLGTLKAVGHNFADSFASGIGLLIGYYEMNVFAEAAAAKAGNIFGVPGKRLRRVRR